MSAFQLVVLGDFAGRAETPLAARKLIAVDRDSFDDVLARIGARVDPDLPFCRSLEIRAWDDFSPDGLVARVPELSRLLEARGEVADPERMRALLDDAGVTLEAQGEAPDTTSAAPPVPSEDAGDLLDSMLDDAPDATAPPRRRYADRELDELLTQIADSTASEDFESQDRWRAAIDRELGARVRAILHAPRFRSVEAAWTGLRELLRAGDTDSAVRVLVLPIGRDELLDAESTAPLERLLYDERAGTPGASRIDFVIADFEIGDERSYLDALGRLAALAKRCSAPLLIGADASLSSLDREPSRALGELKASSDLSALGLCCPRVLLRLPWGPDTAPVDRFEFRESPEGSAPDYTWGTAGPVIGRALVRAISVDGDLAALPRHGAIDGLPFHVYRADGESRSQHPVEHVMTDTMLKELIGRGLLPLAAVVGSDEARIVSLRSVGGASLLEQTIPR